MRLCHVCKKEIKEGDKISVYASPLKCIGKNGAYEIINDFFKKETICHYQCFRVGGTEAIKRDNRKALPNTLEKDLKEALKSLGAKVSDDQITHFVDINKDMTLSQAITEWFKKQNNCIY